MKYSFSKFRKFRLRFASTPLAVKVVFRNLQKKKFEREVFFLDNFINSNDTCLDIGGAYGRYAYPMAKIAKRGRVIAFEPGQYSFYVLKTVKAIFRMKNIEIIKKALGAEKNMGFLISPKKKNGKIGHSLSYISDTLVPNAVCQSIEITTIDSFFNKAELNRLDFIKCDTEGAEMMIFSGAKETIKKYRPVVLAEVEAGHLKKFNNSVQEVESFFKNLNYKVFQVEVGELKEKKSIGEDSNYFFIPEERTQDTKFYEK